MTVNPNVQRAPVPDTFIPSERFHALMEALDAIEDPAGEARDKAIQLALIEVGRIAPESWRSIYD